MGSLKLHDEDSNQVVSINDFELLSLYSPEVVSPKSIPLPLWLAPFKSFLDEESLTGLNGLVRMVTTYHKNLNLSNSIIASSLVLLSKYYAARVPVSYSMSTSHDMELLERIRYLNRYSIACYGWKAMNYFGKGSGFIKDSILDNPNKVTLLRYLSIPEEDLLELNFIEDGPHRPRYFVVKDRVHQAIVISLRGSMTASDWVTSLDGHYKQFEEGYVHSGFYQAGLWVKEHILPRYLTLAKISIFKKIILVGHSLGGAASGMAKFLYEHDHPLDKDITLEAYCFGVPPLFSKSLFHKYSSSMNNFYSIIYGNDFAARTSFGALMDLQSLLLEASQFASISYLVFNTKEAELKELFDKLDILRAQLHSTNEHPKMYLTGKICYLYDLDNGLPIKDNAISESFPPCSKSQNEIEHTLCTVMEQGCPEYFDELAIRSFMFTHHNPLVYEKALHSACLSLARNLTPASQKY